MLRFLEFLGAVTIFFIIIYGFTFLMQGKEGNDLPSNVSVSQSFDTIIPSYENLNLAEGQCSVIEMYSMSWCGYCRVKRQQLQAQKIAFKEYVLDHDRNAERAFKRMMKDMKIRRIGYPTFIINDQYLQNYPVDYLVQKTCS